MRAVSVHTTLRPVLALVAGRQDRARLTQAFQGRAPVTFVSTVAEALSSLRTATPGLVIVDMRDADGRPTVEVIQHVVAAVPGTAVIAYCSAGPEHSAAIREAAQAGAHDLLFRGMDESGVAVRHVMASAVHACAAEILGVSALPLFPPALHRFVRVVLGAPTSVKSVDDAARELGVHRRTLVNQAKRALLPAPGELLMWLRALLAAHYLTTTAQTVEAIAEELDFPTPTALRHLFRRYLGLRATDVRVQGGAPVVIRAMATHFDECRSRSALANVGDDRRPTTLEA